MIRALLLTCVLLAPAQLLAADARQLFTDGSKALSAGKADEAIADFEAAYKAKPAASLLYWLGEAHRAAGHQEKAAEYYKQYLAQTPTGPNAASAQAHLAALGPVAAEKPEKRKKTRKHQSMELAEMDLAIPALPAKAAPPRAEPNKADALALPDADSKPVAIKQTPKDSLSLDLDAAPAPPPAPPPAPAPAPQPIAQPPPPPPPAPAVAAVPPPPPRKKEPPPAPVLVKKAPPPPQAPPSMLLYATYTARLLAPHGVYMGNYSTTVGGGSDGTLYTHGFGAGVQRGTFKLGGYFGFGTEYGGGTDTLKRYELSAQGMWVPFGPWQLVSPYLGLRIGAALIDGQALTGGSLTGRFLLAPEGGVDFQLCRYFVASLGMGYDVIPGAPLNNNSRVSGYSFDLGLTARY